MEILELERIFTIFESDFTKIKENLKVYKYISENREKLKNNEGIEFWATIEWSLYMNIVIILAKFVEKQNNREWRKVISIDDLIENMINKSEIENILKEFEKVSTIRNKALAHTDLNLHMEWINEQPYKSNNIEDIAKYMKNYYDNPKYTLDKEEFNLNINELEKYVYIIWDILFKIDNYFWFKYWFYWLNPND